MSCRIQDTKCSVRSWQGFRLDFLRTTLQKQVDKLSQFTLATPAINKMIERMVNQSQTESIKRVSLLVGC
jgi:hypothetical protein